jgi:hypothetical protein
MSGSASAGVQLFGHLAELLAPAGSLENTSSMVILEPAGKDVGAMGALTGPSAVEAMADLAGAIPAAAASFVDTGSFYDDVWNFVLSNAVPTGPIGDPVRATVARVIEDNRSDFEMMAQARVDLPTDLYHSVRATPTDWLSADGWSSASFRIGDEEADPPPKLPPELFTPTVIPELTWREVDPPPDRGALAIDPGAIGGGAIEPPVIEHVRVEPPPVFVPKRLVRSDDPRIRSALEAVRLNQPVVLADGIRWRDVFAASRRGRLGGTATTASPSTSGFELSFEYRVVGLHRPWLQPQLCRLAGWALPGLQPGGLSNGQPTGNPGLLPVLTTRMLAVRNLVVEARWSEADRAKAGSAGTIAFGPFTVTGQAGFDGSHMTHAGGQVVAWLATVVPACPA